MVRALACSGHSVDVLTRAAFLAIFQNSPYVANAFAIEAIASAWPCQWWTLGEWMRAQHYDNVVLAYGRPAVLCLSSAMSGARRRIAMWSGIMGRLTRHECLRSDIINNPRPISEIILACSRALGTPDKGSKPDFFLDGGERAQIQQLLPDRLRDQALVGIHPGSAGSTCNLPAQIYGELAAQILSRTPWSIIITGTQSEDSLLADWPGAVTTSPRLWNSMGKLNLRQLGAIIAQMRVFVCPSTGPLHLASAVGTPTVSPFCPAVTVNAKIWGNMGAPSEALEPSFCPRREGKKLNCGFLGQISAGDLFGAVEKAFRRVLSPLPK